MASIFGRSIIVPLTNKSGGGVVLGDVVVVDTTTDESFTTTTSAANTSAIGVAAETIASNAVGRVIVGGYASLVNVDASVTRNQFGTTHTVAKQATGVAARTAGTFCRWLTTSATPSAYIYPVDLAGAALTNPMTTAEDIIYGGASGTPTRKAIGAAGAALSVINGALAYNSGTSFPASKLTGDRYWRTDLGMEFYWDGTRWLCTCPHTLEIRPDLAIPLTATGGARTGNPGAARGLDIWAEKFYCSTYVITTNDGTKYWTATLDSEGSVISTISNAASTVILESDNVNAVLSVASYPWITLTITKVSTPGGWYGIPFLDYRFIAT